LLPGDLLAGSLPIQQRVSGSVNHNGSYAADADCVVMARQNLLDDAIDA
jgi:hypothetical protein